MTHLCERLFFAVADQGSYTFVVQYIDPFHKNAGCFFGVYSPLDLCFNRGRKICIVEE
jgi:hypothetical protein